MCNVIKREYVSFKFESTQRISQLKYGSYSNSKKGISDTLRANSDFHRMKKYDYQTEESLDFSRNQPQTNPAKGPERRNRRYHHMTRP